VRIRDYLMASRKYCLNKDSISQNCNLWKILWTHHFSKISRDFSFANKAFVKNFASF